MVGDNGTFVKEGNDKKETRRAALYASLLVAVPCVVHIVNACFSLRLQRFGLAPHDLRGLSGILTMPLLHAGWDHLLSNMPPLWVLTFGLILFYREKSRTIFAYLYLMSGLFTWSIASAGSVHIGASGVIYALAAFHFVTGMIWRVPRQMAFALLVTFLYGGFVWAFFPSLYRHTTISWEGHFSGLVSGIILAIYVRRWGPPPPPDPFEGEDEEPDEDMEAYWKIPDEEQPSSSVPDAWEGVGLSETASLGIYPNEARIFAYEKLIFTSSQRIIFFSYICGHTIIPLC